MLRFKIIGTFSDNSERNIHLYKLTVFHAQIDQVSQFEQYSLAVVDQERQGAKLGVARARADLFQHQLPYSVAVKDLEFAMVSEIE